jgi:hypothetical protein
MIAAARILSQKHHDEKNDVRPPSLDALVKGQRNDKPNIKHEMRALNVVTRVISFATTHKRAV